MNGSLLGWGPRRYAKRLDSDAWCALDGTIVRACVRACVVDLQGHEHLGRW